MSTRLFVLVVSLLVGVLAVTLTAGYLVWTRGDQGTAALIGGPFELVDQNGRTTTPETFEGQWSLIYFGYTYCPDVCPTTLSIMTQALDQLGPLAAKVTPVFVTVDPERDTVAQLKAYQEHFHPSFVMLTGSPERVREAARAYRVYHRKVESESATDYLMDHSSITFLMGPDGGYVTHFGHDATAETMAATLRQKLGG